MKTIQLKQNILMQAGEEMFWDQMDVLSGQPGERYMVMDRRQQIVLVKNARLVREIKRVEV